MQTNHAPTGPPSPAHSAPVLEQLCLNGLCGAWGWSWNASPSSLPEGAPPPAFPALRVCQVAPGGRPGSRWCGLWAALMYLVHPALMQHPTF